MFSPLDNVAVDAWVEPIMVKSSSLVAVIRRDTLTFKNLNSLQLLKAYTEYAEYMILKTQRESTHELANMGRTTGNLNINCFFRIPREAQLVLEISLSTICWRIIPSLTITLNKHQEPDEPLAHHGVDWEEEEHKMRR